MQPRTESRVEGWDTRPFEGGYAGLRNLADRDFSGVVRAAGTWLFMLNGRVVGVFQGSISDFEGADGTTYVAPDPSLPLLFSMQEQGGPVQAKYYTNDTPISEAVQTLTDSNFTGYIELSENVLSGDYYVVFYGGRSMSAAFVGNNESLLTGDEAFARADDEVGIYEVIKVDVEVTDVPEPAGTDTNGGTTVSGGTAASGGAAAGGGMTHGDDDAGDAAGGGAVGDSGGVDASTVGADPEAEAGTDTRQGATSDPLASNETDETPSEPVDTAPEMGDESGVSAEAPQSDTADNDAPPAPDAGARTAPGSDSTTDTASSAGETAEPAAESPPSGSSEPTVDGETDPDPDSDPDPDLESTATSAAREAAENAASAAGTSEAASSAGATTDGAESQSDAGGVGETGAGGLGDAAAEREWQETRTIPSIDPARSAGAGVGDGEAATTPGDSGGTAVGDGPSDRATAEPVTGTSATSETATREETTSPSAPGNESERRATESADLAESAGATDPVEEAVNSQRVEELEGELEEREAQINRLERKLTDVQVERDSLAEERSQLKAEINQLEGEIADLEGRLAQLQESVEGQAAVGQQLDPATALEQTNLFVRYGTKSGGTLAKAHDGQVDAEEVNNNLRLEHHTQFDEGQVSVDGRPFDDFLTDTMEFRFVQWVVEQLLYEIRGTGHQKALKSLYDAIPQIDRAELEGSVSVRYTKDGEEYREQQRFDVVMRDRMGNPLLVVNLNDSRNPATEEMMVGMIEAAGKVKRTNETLSTAMLVTASFFEPQALEEADEATSGGFLGRDSRDSFVKLSRKQGYHLCLVESRGGEFHLTMPEL